MSPKPEFEMFEFPGAYRKLAHITAAGEVEVDMTIEELERESTSAWDLQNRGLARLILEIARLRAQNKNGVGQ